MDGSWSEGPPIKFDVAADEPWVATEGALMIHARTGRSGRVTGWTDPKVWDDRVDRWVDAGRRVSGVAYATLYLTDEAGEQWECKDPDHLHSFDHPPEPPLRILSYADMAAMPEPRWLVQGLLTEGTSALLFGKSNSFKSFLAIDVACAVATGRSWHGHAVSGAGPVLYVATEGARGVGRQRIPGWMEAHDVPMGERGNVWLYPQEIALDDPAAVDALVATCILTAAKARSKLRLLVVDIFGASMNGPETSDETARAWVRNVNRLLREVGCAVLTVAHTGWADETRARMHTHFWGSFDTRLKAEGDKDSRTTVLTVDRHKDADSTGEWGFRLAEATLPDGQTTLHPLLADDVEKGQRRRVSGKPAVALQALSEALIEKGRTVAGPSFPACPVVSIEEWREMCDRHGLTDADNAEATRKAFNRARTTLLDKGLVKQFDGYVWKVPDHAS